MAERTADDRRDRHDNEQMSVRDAGRKGGRMTSARYGRDYFAEIGAKGGRAVSERYPAEHFREIGRKGGRRVAELVARGKQLAEPASAQESE